jgi:hypothetical protein
MSREDPNSVKAGRHVCYFSRKEPVEVLVRFQRYVDVLDRRKTGERQDRGERSDYVQFQRVLKTLIIEVNH